MKRLFTPHFSGNDSHESLLDDGSGSSVSKKPKKSLYRNYFTCLETIKDGQHFLTNKCKQNECSTILKTNEISNLRKHMKNMHPEIFNLINKASKQESKPDGDDWGALIKDIVVDTSVHLTPFLKYDTNNIYKKHIMEKLQQAGTGWKLNGKNAKKLTSFAAESIRREIVKEISGKMVHLMIDIATRKSRQFFSIMIKFWKENENRSVIRSLAVIERQEKNTGISLSEQVFDVSFIHFISFILISFKI